MEIGGYLVEGRIGAGGMGIVYRARARGTLEDVALKILPARACSEAARRRFAREAEAAAALSHPGVVAVRGFGETGDGGLYLAMELLDGESLDARIDRGPLPPAEVLRVGGGAAAGLAAAHAAGIVHRDVKPANLFLCSDGTIKVLDFGLALAVADADETRLTAGGTIAGTPDYMAPEQASGSREEDARTDVWGLGATLFHAASGRPPFAGPTLTAVLVRILTGEPDPLPPAVPAWLAAPIARALSKSKEGRFATMAAFSVALETGPSDAALAETAVVRHEALPVALGDEVRIVSALLGEGVVDFAAFEQAVAACRGTASPLIGRRAVGIFGGEEWLGDEGERAVRAGLAARPAAARLGVATGRAVRARTGDVTGAAVAEAERVLSDVGVGADGATLRRIRGGFETEGHRVLASRPGRAVVGARGLASADVPLVGREPEMAQLDAIFRAVALERQAVGVLISGPAGIGKSRLLSECVSRLANDVVCVEGRAEAHRTIEGWHTISSALRSRLDIAVGSPPSEAREKLLSTCPSRACAEFLGEILGADFPPTPALRIARADPLVMRDRLVVAIGDWFEGLTRTGPVVLTVEDLHWADGPSLEVIEVLVRRLETRPLFVLATARPDLSAPLPDFRRLPLAGMSRQATRAIVRGIVGDDQTADAIHDKSGGNPFFAEELALAAAEGRSDLPSTVEAAVQGRLDALGREEKDLLRRASVLGRHFWVEALVAMGETDPARRLARLRRREVTVPEPRPRLPGTTEWRFRHAIVREVAYGSLTEAQRAGLHRAAGNWLASRTDARPAEVARHLDAGGDEEGAHAFWLRGAEAAFQEGDAPLALEASSRALERLADRRVAFRLRRMRVEVLHFLGKREEEGAEIEALAAFADPGVEQAAVHAFRARRLDLLGRYAEASREIEEGRGAAGGEPGLDLLFADASNRALSGRPAEALQPAEAALETAARRHDAVGTSRALLCLAYVHALLGDVGLALGLHERALAASEDRGDPRWVAQIRGRLAYCALVLGRYEEAAGALEQVRDLCRAAGCRTDEGYALHNLGLARARRGDVEGGLAAEDAALAIAVETQHPRLQFACLGYKAAILVEAGRAAEALPIIRRALAEPDDRLGAAAADLRTVLAASLLAVGRGEEARTEAERAIALRDAGGGMTEREAELFLAAHESGVPGALARGHAALLARAEKISDPEMRRSFLERVPANARLRSLARAAGIASE